MVNVGKFPILFHQGQAFPEATGLVPDSLDHRFSLFVDIAPQAVHPDRMQAFGEVDLIFQIFRVEYAPDMAFVTRLRQIFRTVIEEVAPQLPVYDTEVMTNPIKIL